MTLLWSDTAIEAFNRLRSVLEPSVMDRVVRRLILLENDASTFEATYGVIEMPESGAAPEGTGPLCGHVMEAAAGHVVVVLYRLVVDAEDVWLVGLHHGR